jgi:glucokinase
MAKGGKGNNGCVVGVDLGGTKILAAVVDSKFSVLSRSKSPTASEDGPEAVVDRIVGCIKAAVKQTDLRMKSISGIGIGAPGPLNPDTGVVAFAPNLGWHDVPLKDMLESRLSIPTVVENDVNAGTLGEHRLGAGQGVKDMIGVFVGTGIGGGVVTKGKLHRGFNQSAGEVGHMVVEMDGPMCGCGNPGCWEAVASRTAIARRLAKAMKSKKNARTPIYRMTGGDPSKIKSGALKRALLKGDPLVKQELRREADYLGLGVANLVNFFSPQMVVMGGGVVEALGERLLKRVRRQAGRYALEHAIQGVKIVPAKLGDDAVFIGCAALVRDRVK